MADEHRQHILQSLRARLPELDLSQDETELRAPCPLTADCLEAGDNSLTLDVQTNLFRCSNCEAQGSLEQLLNRLETRLPVPISSRELAEMDEVPPPPLQASIIEPEEDTAIEATYSNVSPKAERPVLRTPPKIHHLTEAHRHLTARERKQREKAARREARKGQHRGEHMIIAALALIFLCAGLAAATLSGFANYQAFSQSVADPLQSAVWGWTGVIASIVSFGGFTFFYWHTANKRMKEGIRAMLFALAGAATSIIGTQMYIASNNEAAAAEVQQAGTNRQIIESQIADWRQQLAGIPPETRSVEGLETYLAEVERVGRTHQKPYRDAQNELGLAKRRDDLLARIDQANAQLLGTGSDNILTQAQVRTNIPGWFFAVMLELFSSQGTSIALVALLILFGPRPRSH